MTNIQRPISPDPRSSLIEKHLPDTSQVQTLLRKEGKAYVFNDKATMDRVTEVLIAQGERTGATDAKDVYERYGLYFSDPIGYIIRADSSRTLLYYGELKIIKATGEYHAVPRKRPRHSRA
jgi:hypothetical protein